jgi:quinol-cytochrome oxidoreductase complex cytochrome b subunit
MLLPVPVRSVDRLVLALLLLTAVVSVATVLCGFVLLETYRPSFAEAWSQAVEIGSSRNWVRAHDAAARAAAVLAAATFAAGAVAAVRGSRRLGTGSMAVAVPAGLGAVIALATRSAVRYDQLGLWAVTVGTDISGYRIAGFGEGIRFVIVDGVEVSPGDYAVTLVVHLGAPVIGAVATGVALAVLARRGSR